MITRRALWVLNASSSLGLYPSIRAGEPAPVSAQNDIQHRGCEDISADKLLVLGKKLKDIYEAKLRWEFPDEPCRVELYVPDEPDDLDEYQLSFWQVSHENDGT